jgi:hypothetical protein
MPVNEEDCARIVFWSVFIIFNGFMKWGCGGFMGGSRDQGVWGLPRLMWEDG